MYIKYKLSQESNGQITIIKKLFLVLAALIMLAFSTLVTLGFINLELSATLEYAYIFFVFVLLFVLFNRDLKKISPMMVVIYYTLIQAVGIPLGYLADRKTAHAFLMRSKTFYGIYLDKYIAISCIAIIAMMIAVVMVKKMPEFKPSISINNDINVRRNYYYKIGVVLLLLFAVFMLYSVVAGYISFANHDAYTEWASSSRLRNYLQFGYWFGSLFVICSFTRRKQLIFPMILFGFCSLILLLTGNRNDFLYPLIIGLSIYSFRGFKLPMVALVLLLAFILFVSPLIAATRMNGISMDTDKTLTELASSSCCELGSQLTPVSSMFEWLENGESHAYGATYIFSSLVELGGMIFSDLRTSFLSSQFNIPARLPDLGFSMCAEVYYNFSIIGILIIYFVFGYIMAKKEMQIITIDNLVKYSFLAFSLLYLVRNSFSAFISIIILFYLLYYLEKLIRQYRKPSKKGA